MVINRESKVQNVAASATKILRLPPSSQRNAIFPQTFKAGRGGLGTRLRVTSYNLHCVGLVDFDDSLPIPPLFLHVGKKKCLVIHLFHFSAIITTWN